MSEVHDINVRTTALLGFDLRDQIATSKRLATEAAEARALAEHMEHLRKVVLSDEILSAHRQARATGSKLTAPEAEALARTSPAYKVHLDGLQEAQRDRGVLYARASAAAQAVDLGFRQLSFLQTELKAGGGG